MGSSDSSYTFCGIMHKFLKTISPTSDKKSIWDEYFHDCLTSNVKEPFWKSSLLGVWNKIVDLIIFLSFHLKIGLNYLINHKTIAQSIFLSAFLIIFLMILYGRSSMRYKKRKRTPEIDTNIEDLTTDDSQSDTLSERSTESQLLSDDENYNSKGSSKRVQTTKIRRERLKRETTKFKDSDPSSDDQPSYRDNKDSHNIKQQLDFKVVPDTTNDYETETKPNDNNSKTPKIPTTSNRMPLLSRKLSFPDPGK